EQAKLEASKIKEGIIREAYEEGEKVKSEYRRKARKEMEELLSGLREDIVELTEEVVRKFLATQVTPEVQTRLIDMFLEEALKQLEAQVEIIHGR
ncbi:MAG: ATP synthase F0 subunit B, partial [Atribacterota bacterium]|nr:ATP synthase F0 subunit B [Atribacterota bacterium]